ncbi:MAG: hypothetical protein ACRYGG_21990 [Janthinobacterium lividum]
MSTFDEAYQWGRDRATQGSQRKQALSDADLESHLETYSHAIDGLTSKLGTVAPGSAEHTATQADLAKAIQDRTALFHPDNNPGALQRFGKQIADKLHMLHPELAQQARIHLTPTPGEAAVPASTSPGMPGAGPLNNPELPAIPAGNRATLAPSTDPRVMRAQAEANLLSSSAPAYQAPVLDHDEMHQAARIKAGIDEKAVPDKPTAQKQVVLVDSAGKQHIGYYVNGEFKEFQGTDGLSAPQKATPGPKVGSFGDFMKAGYGDNPTAQQYEAGRRAWAASVAGTTHGTHDIQVPQPDGTIKLVTVETSSSKTFGPTGHLPSGRQDHPSPVSTPPQTSTSVSTPGKGGPSAVRSKPDSTPGALKSRAVKPAPVSRSASPQKPSGGGRTVGGKQLPQATKALEAVDQAEGAYRDVKQSAENPTPLGDKGIVLAWLRGRVNRVTATEIQSVSSLGGAKFALENGIARITEGKMSNAQRQWFLKSAEDNYTNTKAVASKYSGAPAASDLGPKKGEMSDDDFLRNLK